MQCKVVPEPDYRPCETSCNYIAIRDDMGYNYLTMPHLVDGHNVISALPDIDLEEEHDEAKLVLKLRAWTGRKRRKAIVIFDGGIPGGYSRSLSSAAVRVIFAARHHTTADNIIKERLSHLPDAPNWTVVSSDHEVLDNARMAGAKVLSAQEFADVLNREPDAKKVKPETISAAEVQAWLEEFPEPAPSSKTRPSVITPQPTPEKTEAAQFHVDRGTKRPTPRKSPIRMTRTIGEQMGVEEKPPDPPRKPQRRTEKPDEVSAAEVDAWLEVFHDPPDSQVPPPKLRKRKPQLRMKKELVVNKDEGLSTEEVEDWLQIFGDLPEPPPEPVKKAEGSKAKAKPRSSAARLVKRKRNVVPTGAEKGSSLSAEDEDLWRRMFGEGDS